MYKVIHGIVETYSDVAAFVESLQNEKLTEGKFFTKDRRIFITRAPGRLDVMGGMADYSGATVFEATTEEAIICAIQRRNDKEVHVRSVGTGENSFSLEAAFSLDEILAKESGKIYAKTSSWLREKNKGKEWLAFPAGAFAVLAAEKNYNFREGANIFIRSNLPMQRGVGSSAALEVSLFKALTEAYRAPSSHRDIPYLAHILENKVVKNPCGMMDQYASSHGVEGHLLPIVCQPDTVLDPVPVKEDIAIIGIDTGIDKLISKEKYINLRTAAFMGYRIIADILGLKVRETETRNLVEIDDPHYDGYLANIQTSHFDDRFREKLPEKMSGKEFLKKYKGITDSIVAIDENKHYPIRVACQNQVYENLRTVLFLQLLRAYVDNHNEQLLISLGELMFLSHRSYRECGLASDHITDLVRKIRIAGPRVGLYGAKITGSGTGPIVAVLLKKTAMPYLKKLLNDFAGEKDLKPQIYYGNSPGALEFDHLELEWYD